MNSVIKGTSYILAHTPDMVVHNGTTQTTEHIVNPASEYLVKLPNHLRSYADAVSYPPNQVYIGNLRPEALDQIGEPWHDKKIEGAVRFGKLGEIMPQDEFYMLIQACDVFDLVRLEKGFVAEVRPRFEQHPLLDESVLARVHEGVELSEIEKAVSEEHAEGLYQDVKLVGCIKKAHVVDQNLSANVILENLTSKASSVLSLLHLIKTSGIGKSAVDLVIDCSEEACGDMNQRGGGNIAKAAAEIAGLTGASGDDIRAFCAAPAHAIIHAAALVSSGTYENVAVAAGGATAKLGMNGKDHIRKGLPILEDCIGGFAVLISKNDGKNPEILSEYTGKHTVGSGSSPQAVITALVADPLDKMGIKILDVDKYSAEMQNPDITKPAGAGDVPLANYKMIGALAVMRGEIERADLANFPKRHGMTGWAPTQGHIPSGVPYLGFAREDLLSGKISRCMIIGKGSLFLGRMTNLFDGVSFIIEANGGIEKKEHQTTGIGKKARVGLTVLGSEHPVAELVKGAEAASAADPLLEVILIGCEESGKLEAIGADTPEACLRIMDEMLAKGQLDAAVAMHYAFPISVSTVGRVVTPAFGRKVYIANTTGTSATERVEALVRNTIAGIAVAKACGNQAPSVGLLNLEGARQAERILRTLSQNGYPINFAESGRADGGVVMRGNDLLRGVPDIMVMDSLTGNVMVKIFSAFSSGGSYESSGDGYGPGVGENYGKIVNIISRASGAPVIAGALLYAGEASRGNLSAVFATECAAAKKAGLDELLHALTNRSAVEEETVIAPPEKAVNEEITGIEVFVIEDAVKLLWQNGIYAASGMGCTGPVVMVASEDHTKARELLKQGGYL
jgi:betaine reductase